MVFDMGESRPKDASHWWRDPFAAYRTSKKKEVAPLPIRPVEHRVLWREYAGFFLPSRADEQNLKAFRPQLINQLEVIHRHKPDLLPSDVFHFRTIGLRTDMKMKIFEWDEAGFAVPPHLLNNSIIAEAIRQSIDFAVKIEGTLKSTFNQYFGGGGKSERYKPLKQQMSQQYWQKLGEQFHHYILQLTPTADPEIIKHTDWIEPLIHIALSTFSDTVYQLPASGETAVPSKVKRYKELKQTEIKLIRLREDAITDCRKFVYGYRKKHQPKPTSRQEVS